MYTGSIPPTSIYNTWLENVEITSADDGGLVDLSALVDIIIKVRNPVTGLDDLTLFMSGGDITLPSLGIIQWKVESGTMALMRTKLYEVILLLLDADGDTTTLLLGNISIVE